MRGMSLIAVFYTLIAWSGSAMGVPDLSVTGDAGTEGGTDAGAAADIQPSDATSPQPDMQPLPDWAPKLTATIKPASANLGDPVQITIKLKHRKGVSVTLPLSLDLGKFSELSRKDASKELGAKGEMPVVERIFTVQVAAYELGEQTLPPIEVTALGPGGELVSLHTPAMPIQITSVMRNEPNAKLKGLEPPVTVFQRTWWLLYAIIAIAAVGLIVTATLLISRQLRARRERAKPPPPPIPPHLIALELLAKIDVEAFIAEEKYKELYLHLSEITREYAGGRWGFDAMEMTTTEISESMEIASVEQEIRQRFATYFNNCDLVKFAKYRPEADMARQAIKDAESLVRETAQIDVMTPQAQEQESHGQR